MHLGSRFSSKPNHFVFLLDSSLSQNRLSKALPRWAERPKVFQVGSKALSWPCFGNFSFPPHPPFPFLAYPRISERCINSRLTVNRGLGFFPAEQTSKPGFCFSLCSLLARGTGKDLLWCCLFCTGNLKYPWNIPGISLEQARQAPGNPAETSGSFYLHQKESRELPAQTEPSCSIQASIQHFLLPAQPFPRD